MPGLHVLAPRKRELVVSKRQVAKRKRLKYQRSQSLRGGLGDRKLTQDHFLLDQFLTHHLEDILHFLAHYWNHPIHVKYVRWMALLILPYLYSTADLPNPNVIKRLYKEMVDNSFKTKFLPETLCVLNNFVNKLHFTFTQAVFTGTLCGQVPPVLSHAQRFLYPRHDFPEGASVEVSESCLIAVSTQHPLERLINMVLVRFIQLPSSAPVRDDAYFRRQVVRLANTLEQIMQEVTRELGPSASVDEEDSGDEYIGLSFARRVMDPDVCETWRGALSISQVEPFETLTRIRGPPFSPRKNFKNAQNQAIFCSEVLSHFPFQLESPPREAWPFSPGAGKWYDQARRAEEVAERLSLKQWRAELARKWNKHRAAQEYRPLVPSILSNWLFFEFWVRVEFQNKPHCAIWLSSHPRRKQTIMFDFRHVPVFSHICMDPKDGYFYRFEVDRIKHSREQNGLYLLTLIGVSGHCHQILPGQQLSRAKFEVSGGLHAQIMLEWEGPHEDFTSAFNGMCDEHFGSTMDEN